MIKRLVLMAFVAFLFTTGAAAVSAQWQNLGTKDVLDRSDRDTWHVGGNKGEFRKIKLTVHDRAVRFYTLEVKFENGQKQNIEIRNVIQAGGETRAIDLVGSDRRIDKVEVWYEAQTVRRGRRSRVTLHGFK